MISEKYLQKTSTDYKISLKRLSMGKLSLFTKFISTNFNFV